MTTITGVRIDAGVDEKIQHVHLDGRDLLRALYDTLSCGTIETAALRGGLDAIFDEEGKITGAEPNHHATAVALLIAGLIAPALLHWRRRERATAAAGVGESGGRS